MPNLNHLIRTAVSHAVRERYDIDADPAVAVTGDPKFGDYQSNVAMGLAKRVAEKTGRKANPREIAQDLTADLGTIDGLSDAVTVAGPGFINVTLARSALVKLLKTVSADAHLGVTPADPPQTVVIDYSGPNIAKEMHVGHLRSTILGDAAARVLAFTGHNVIRQNHLGDWGTQFGMLIEYLADQKGGGGGGDGDGDGIRTGGNSDGGGGGIGLSDLEGFYRAAKKRFDGDSAFQDAARRRVVALQGGDEQALAAWQTIVDETRRNFQPLYGRLNVQLTPDDEYGESKYNPRLRGVVDDLRAAGLAVESDGATVVFIDGPKKPPLIVEKTGGGFLYGTTDLAAVRYRVGDLHADRVVYFVDARQGQHFGQVFNTARQAGWAGEASLEHAAFGMILGKDSRPFKTRDGQTIKLKALLDEAQERALAVVRQKNPDLPPAEQQEIARVVGVGAVKYADLSKDRTSDYVFDFDSMLALDGNTAPYLMYAYARIRSIFRKAGNVPDAAHFPVTVDAPQERALTVHLLRFAETIDHVARELRPHVLCTYLFDLATAFSAFYEHCPVLKSKEPLRTSRLALCELTARTLEKGLELLGIEHPDEM